MKYIGTSQLLGARAPKSTPIL